MALRRGAFQLALVSALLGARGAFSTAAEKDIFGDEDGKRISQAASRELAVVREEQRLERGEASPGLRAMEERRLDGVNMNKHASAHLNYKIGEFGSIRTWYGQLTPGQSSADTYFSVLGHAYGYLGLQQVEEAGLCGRVVFSIFDNDCGDVTDESDCPKNEQAQVVECGKDADCSRFGNEGTGVKAQMSFHEQIVEESYGFVIQVFDEGIGKVRFDGYVSAQELGGWTLIGKLRVNRGSKTAKLYRMYSFVEQWSERNKEDARFASFGPMFVETNAQPGVWSELMQAFFSYSTATDTRFVHASVTNGGTQWGVGMGGGIVRGIMSGTLLTLTTPVYQPHDLTAWVQLRNSGNLPGGCLGGTCTDEQTKEFFHQLLCWQTIGVASIFGLVVVLPCGLLIGWAGGGGLVGRPPVCPACGRPKPCGCQTMPGTRGHPSYEMLRSEGRP